MKFDFNMDLNVGLWHLCDWVLGWYPEWALVGPPGYVFSPLCCDHAKNIPCAMKFNFGIVKYHL